MFPFKILPEELCLYLMPKRSQGQSKAGILGEAMPKERGHHWEDSPTAQGGGEPLPMNAVHSLDCTGRHKEQVAGGLPTCSCWSICWLGSCLCGCCCERACGRNQKWGEEGRRKWQRPAWGILLPNTPRCRPRKRRISSQKPHHGQTLRSSRYFSY